MSRELEAFYKANAHALRTSTRGAKQYTRLQTVNHKIFGEPSQRKCKTKAAETWGLANFWVALLREEGPRLGADASRLLESGECLVAMCRLFDNSGVDMREGDMRA